MNYKIYDMSNNLQLYRTDIDYIFTYVLGQYPNAYKWFLEKVIPELPTRRKILGCFIKGKIVAITILKIDDLDEKICTFYVRTQYRRQGIGTSLLKECLKYVKHPYMIVKSNGYFLFKRLLGKFGFEIISSSRQACKFKLNESNHSNES